MIRDDFTTKPINDIQIIHLEHLNFHHHPTFKKGGINI